MLKKTHQSDRIDTRTLFLILGSMLAVIGLLLLGVHHFYRNSVLPAPPLEWSGPQPDFAMSIDEQQRRQRQRLQQYGWVEPENNIVHIPIERAISLILERGAASRQTSGEQP